MRHKLWKHIPPQEREWFRENEAKAYIKHAEVMWRPCELKLPEYLEPIANYDVMLGDLEPHGAECDFVAEVAKFRVKNRHKGKPRQVDTIEEVLETPGAFTWFADFEQFRLACAEFFSDDDKELLEPLNYRYVFGRTAEHFRRFGDGVFDLETGEEYHPGDEVSYNGPFLYQLCNCDLEAEVKNQILPMAAATYNWSPIEWMTRAEWYAGHIPLLLPERIVSQIPGDKLPKYRTGRAFRIDNLIKRLADSPAGQFFQVMKEEGVCLVILLTKERSKSGSPPEWTKHIDLTQIYD
jgi:hypothetical protein